MSLLQFPRRLLREKSHSWNLVGTAASPGPTLRVPPALVRTDGGGYWFCTMTDISLSGAQGLTGRDRQRLSTLLWRAVRQAADGGVNPLVVPRNDALFRPWPSGVPQSDGLGLPFDDDALFDDGVGFYQPTIDIVAAAAALRATSLDISVNYAGALIGGESFSIDHATFGPRIYEIATVDYLDDASATITFMPPLREEIGDDTPLNFDRPCCVMRLASTNAMDLSVVPWTFNQASVSFVEYPGVVT